MCNRGLILIMVVAAGLAGIAHSQAAANYTVSVSPSPPNLTLDINIPSLTSPVSVTDLLAGTDLRVSGNVSAGAPVYLKVMNQDALDAQNVNVIIHGNSTALPFDAFTIIGITPTTRSGTYNITIAAMTGGEQAGSAVVHLSVMNPSNTTFLYASNASIPTAAEVRTRLASSLNTSTVASSSTTVQQTPAQQGGPSQGYIYAILAVAVIAIALAFALRRKR